jgi:CRP/FNR family cyclic AMP-dependent transcriptional regulator
MFFRRQSDKSEVLKRVPLFSNLSQRQLGLIARHADEVHREAGRILAKQGEIGLEFLLLVEGTARVERDGTFLARLKAGDFFGEMSLIDGKPRSATVIAETPVILLAIHRRSFSYLLDTIPALPRKMLTTLCERLRQADETMLN